MRCSNSIWSPSKLSLLLNSARRTQLGIIVEEECGSGEIWGETNVDKLFAGDKDQKIAVFDCHLKKRWSADGTLAHVLQPNCYTWGNVHLHFTTCRTIYILNCTCATWGITLWSHFEALVFSLDSIRALHKFVVLLALLCRREPLRETRDRWREGIWGCDKREQRRNIGRKRKMQINTDKCIMGRHHKSYHIYQIQLA